MLKNYCCNTRYAKELAGLAASAEKAWRAAMAPSIGRPKTLKVTALQTSATPSTTIPLQAFVASLYSIQFLVVCLVQRLSSTPSIQTGAFVLVF